ncbi:MAG: GspE/PulE family protein [Verrucomicrobia bacterium]|nr:GspE/PulE family protein [Verrucomicrobiota bacterium]
MKKTDSNSDVQSDNAAIQTRLLADKFGLRFLEHIPARIPGEEFIAELSVEWARAHCLLPILLDGVACVLTADPRSVDQQEYLAMLVGRELEPVVAPNAEILKAIERAFYHREETPGAFLESMRPGVGTSESRSANISADLLESTREAPVTQLVNLILLEAVKMRASDIHFEPYTRKLRVRYRIDGLLYEHAAPPQEMQEALISRLKVMANMDIAEKRLPQDGMAKVRVGDREIDLRVSTIPVPDGERVVLRILDTQSTQLKLGALGLSEALESEFTALLKHRNGMIVVSGPTGSGKTTTLYAALGMLDAKRRNILTIEEPIEYQIPDIGQIQVRPKIGLTFASGLRHILRQDPDVILVGETRDVETAEISMRAALTGHLVFTTLHTNDAPSAILRLRDMGIEAFLLASCLRGVMAQRLVRTVCEQCREEHPLTEEDRKILSAHRVNANVEHRVHAVGCEYCLDGYHGRQAIFELMRFGREEARAIHDGAISASDLQQLAVRRGMRTLVQDGLQKALQGITTLEEVLATVAVDLE